MVSRSRMLFPLDHYALCFSWSWLQLNTKRNYQHKELLEVSLPSVVLSKPTPQNLVHVLSVKSIFRLNILNLVLWFRFSLVPQHQLFMRDNGNSGLPGKQNSPTKHVRPLYWACLLISVPLLLKVDIWRLHPKEKKGQSTDTFLFSFREKQVEPMKKVRTL